MVVWLCACDPDVAFCHLAHLSFLGRLLRAFRSVPSGRPSCRLVVRLLLCASCVSEWQAACEEVVDVLQIVDAEASPRDACTNWRRVLRQPATLTLGQVQPNQQAVFAAEPSCSLPTPGHLALHACAHMR
jgi:hypothetical protein